MAGLSSNLSPSGLYKANSRQGDRGISSALLSAAWKELVHTSMHQGIISPVALAVAFHFNPIIFTRLQVPLEIMSNQSAQSQQ